VIIPFWNNEKYLEEAIRSVFAQTYPSWELLLVNDGSTDSSGEIAERLAGEMPGRVRYLTHSGGENRGASASRNLGIQHARGEFIAFLDGDDLYLPHKLADQVPLLDSQPEAAMLFGRSRLWYSWTGVAEDFNRDAYTRTAPRFNTLFRPPELLVAHLEDPDVYPTTCSVLIRRDAIVEVGGCEESFRDTYEDMVLFIKLLAHYPAYVVPDCWDRYRRHSESCWAVAERNGQYRAFGPHPARAAFLDWMERYLEEEGMADGEAWQILQEQLQPYRRGRLHRALSLPKALPGMARQAADAVADAVLPAPVNRAVRKRIRRARPWRGWVRFGSLRRTTPVSAQWGLDRGTPVDRFYIERFLAAHAADIRGHVMEVAGDMYTRRFGGDRVQRVDVLHVKEGNPSTTIVADLADADHLPADTFDCIVITQTLQYIFDARAAVATLFRLLKPGGVVLATLPGISEMGDDETGALWHWSFTPTSARSLFREHFPPENVHVSGHGNVLAAVAFLHGLAAEELKAEELEEFDPRYVISTTVRAVKPPHSA